jgi:hypothetical protein
LVIPASHPVVSAFASSAKLMWSFMVHQKRCTPGLGGRG